MLDAILRLLPVKALYNIMGFPRAVLVEIGATFIVDFDDVLPKQRSVEVLCLGPGHESLLVVSLIVDAHLAKIFKHHLLPGQLGLRGSTVLATFEAILVFKVLVTVLALPEDVTRSHENLVAKSLVDWVEVLEEIKGLITCRAEPDVVLDSVVWMLNAELRYDE